MKVPLLTKKDLAERQQRSLSSIDTACSRNRESVPPFIKLGPSKNSPIRFPLEGVLKWEAEQEEKQRIALESSRGPSLDDLLNLKGLV